VAGQRGLLGNLSPPTSERLVQQLHELLASRATSRFRSRTFAYGLHLGDRDSLTA